MDKRLHSPMQRTGETGMALITGLIFLVVLTMIGITAAKMAGLEVRMSGNQRDRSLAMQAAEMALRDAERDILKVRTLSGLTGFLADCGAATAPSSSDGLCYNGPAGYASPIWTTASMTAAPSVAYHHITSADANPIPLVSTQPRYLIEGIRKTPPGGDQTFYYRITVRAQGAYPNTVVWLQELLAP